MLQDMHAKPQLSVLLSMEEKEIESSSDQSAQILTSYQQKQKKKNYNDPFSAACFLGEADVTQQITRSKAAAGCSDDFSSLRQLSP